MRFNDLLHLVAFPWKAHGRPPAPSFVTAAKMPDSRALSKSSDQFRSLHTPVRRSPHPRRGAAGGVENSGAEVTRLGGQRSSQLEPGEWSIGLYANASASACAVAAA